MATQVVPQSPNIRPSEGHNDVIPDAEVGTQRVDEDDLRQVTRAFGLNVQCCIADLDFVAQDLSINAVYPHSRHPSPTVRAFIDFLVDRFGPEPYWDLVG